MDGSPYWNPKTETLPRRDLGALQGHRLRRLVERVWHTSPSGRRRLDAAGVDPGRIRGIEDLGRIPPATRDDWLADQERHPPWGDMLTGPSEDAIRYHATAGSRGRTPLRVLEGRSDWKGVAECWCHALHGFGVRARDRVFIAFPYSTSVGFWGAHGAAEKMGCLVLPSGRLSTVHRLHLVEELRATVVCTTPSYALRLAQEATNLGMDLAGGSVERIVLSGEPMGATPSTKRWIEEQWSAKAGDTAGIAEAGTVTTFECERQPGGVHIIEDHFLEEVLRPGTHEPAAYGEEGERVVTAFGRGLMPLLRHRTGELVVKVPHTTCDCGRTWDLYEGGIRGRVDDMLLVRGTNVHPRAVSAIVAEYPAVDEFQIHLFTVDGIRDEIEVLCEVREGYAAQWGAVARRLCDDLSMHTEGLGFTVRAVEDGTLPRPEPAALRVKDDRVAREG